MKQLDEVLGQCKKVLYDMIDAFPLAISITDREGRCTHVNPAAVQFLGGRPARDSTQWYANWKLYHDNGTPLPHDHYPTVSALNDGHSLRGVEMIAERPDGTRLCFTAYSTLA